ncbi:MAG: hypothetical protein V3T05_10325 [Myxococcota bacterium]
MGKDKVECNENRTLDFESSCSSNIVRTDGGTPGLRILALL